MIHNYEESEAELKAILEAEKWETCYKELETRWKEKNEDVIFLNEKSCYKLPDIKLPKGYYLFDLHEHIENIANEYYDGLSEEEVKTVLESEKWVTCYKEYKEEETRLKEEISMGILFIRNFLGRRS